MDEAVRSRVSIETKAYDIDGLMQEKHNPIASGLELRLFVLTHR